jgi:eukaryotic-like serine/threonine-protein kinase
MGPGEIVADRFELERVAGQGGMGVVYRARDLETGAPIAVKILTSESESQVDRFLQEAKVLADLRHPAVVRYVTHGLVSPRRPFIAMEWLDGEDLEDRLARGPLLIDEALRLIREAASGLSVAHAAGIIHRDVKPRNLFLVGHDATTPKLLDFGAARLRLGSQHLTRTGGIIGTVGFIAPEQARCDQQLDARADIFSLGCVLFGCVTGRPAFSGKSFVAVLAKVLLEESPRIRRYRPDAPAALDELAASMLSKDREERPADCDAIVRSIDAILSTSTTRNDHRADDPPTLVSGPLNSTTARSSSSRSPTSQRGLTDREQRFTSVIMADPQAEGAESSTVLGGFSAEIAQFGGEVVRLANGSLMVTVASRGRSTADEVGQAAGCALALRDAFPHSRIALATGLAENRGPSPVGLVIERAAALLQDCRPGSQRGPIHIDDVAARLLASRFDVRSDPQGSTLLGKRSHGEGSHGLLGRRTPFVGRAKELALLKATLEECVSEPVARAVLVTAPAGMGKSRLRFEFAQAAQREVGEELLTLTAAGDPPAAGSSLSMVRQLVRAAAGLPDTAADEVERYARFHRHLSEYLSGEQLVNVAEFLGDLVDAPTPGSPSSELRAARNDPRIRRAWLHRMFVDWLGGICTKRPVLVVLEDLQWGDGGSVSYIDDALRELHDSPLMVLAVGRPEIHRTYPKLWEASLPQEIRLGGLTKSAGKRLARAVLGDTVDDDTLSALVAKSEGNAFFIEELVRRVAEGHDSLPETILAMVQSRMDALDPEDRLMLRAASVLGHRISVSALATLLGREPDDPDTESRVRHLEEEELLEAVEARGVGSRRYSFRHDLLREAAYVMLTESDRQRGHLLAAAWLEAAGERDAMVIADHLERGGETSEVVPWLVKAARTAMEAGNLSATASLVERATRLGAQGESLGALQSLGSWAWGLQGQWEEALEAGMEALELLPGGSQGWFQAAAAAVFGANSSGRPDVVAQVVQRMMRLESEPEATGPFGFATCLCSTGLLHAGQREIAITLQRRLEAAAARTEDRDADFQGWLAVARVLPAVYVDLDLGAALDNARQAVEHFVQAKDVLGELHARTMHGFARAEAGWGAEASEELARIAEQAAEHGIALQRDLAALFRVRALVAADRFDEARTAARGLLSGAEPFTRQISTSMLAEAELATGRLDEAEDLAHKITDDPTVFMLVPKLVASTVLSRIARMRGDTVKATEHAEQAMALCERGVGGPTTLLSAHLSQAEALLAAGHEQAAPALQRAQALVARFAETLPSTEERRRFRLGLATNRRIEELASQFDT